MVFGGQPCQYEVEFPDGSGGNMGQSEMGNRNGDAASFLALWNRNGDAASFLALWSRPTFGAQRMQEAQTLGLPFLPCLIPIRTVSGNARLNPLHFLLADRLVDH